MVAEHNTDLSNAREQLQQYILQIEDLAALQERNRIARDIHDSLGNALTTLNIQLQTALKLWHLDPAQAETFLAEAQRLGTLAMKEVRQSISNMREDGLLEQSPEALINSLVENFYSSTGVLPSTEISLLAPFPVTVFTTVYRIVQESLTNICKYAQATQVQISLNATPTKVYLSIKDNGKGFRISQNKTGFGLQGMRERVTALKGDLYIETEPGAGCKITVELPLTQLSIEEEKKPEELKLTIPQKAKLEAHTYSVVSLEQYNRLEKILVKLIGPVASTLLTQVAASASSYEKLIAQLALHLTSHQQNELKKEAMLLLETFSEQPESQSDNLLSNESQAITETFIRQCEQDLTNLIGPIASFLVQKAIKSAQVISRTELVNILAKEIPEPHTALKFKMHLLA